MLKRLLILAAPLVLLAASARAEEKPKAVLGQYVELQPVALPIISDGRLVNYAFVYVRVNFAGGADVSRLRTKEPFFRDALIRESHRAPFTVASDWRRIDEARLSAAMMRAAPAIVGPGVVTSVVVTSQAPRGQVMPPRPSSAG